MAEAWLLGQEPYLSSREIGQSVDEVEKLIKRHEAFEKSAATWDERFSALERLTTVRGRLAPGLSVPLAASFPARILDPGIRSVPLLLRAARIFRKWVAILVQNLGKLGGYPPSIIS